MSVESRPWYFQFQWLTIEYLIIVESWRCCIKSYLFACNWFVVTCTLLVSLNLIKFIVFHACDLILYTKNCIFLVNMFSFIALANNFLSCATLGSQDPYAWILGWVAAIKSIEFGFKYAIWFCTLCIQSRFHSTCRMCSSFVFRDQVERGFCAVGRLVCILAWVWTIFRFKPTVACLWSCRAKNSKFNSLRFCQSPVFLNLVQAFTNRRVVWIVYIDIGSWTRYFCASEFVTISWIHTTEGNMDCLLN